jgi:hypothetical protein
MKRLRKDSDRKLKYYICGEYGGKKNRPHYHAIIFNADPEKVEKAWSFYKIGNRRSSIGSIFIGEVNEASIGYTLKYMQKPGKIPMHKNDDRLKEFSLMSKGLGANYLSPAMKKWHYSDLENRMYVPLKDGKKVAMPRYYKDKIYNDIQKQTINRHFKKIMPDKIEEEWQDLVKEHGEFAGKQYSQKVEQLFRRMYNDSQLGRDKLEKL